MHLSYGLCLTLIFLFALFQEEYFQLVSVKAYAYICSVPSL